LPAFQSVQAMEAILQPIKNILRIYKYIAILTFHQVNSRLVTLLEFIFLHIVCLKIINFV
jgi:hypothetical protein